MIKNDEKTRKKISNNVVETPKDLSIYIYKKLYRKSFKNILDIGCFKGNLSTPFSKIKNTKIIGIDVINDYKDKFDFFIYKDFLDTTKEDYKDLNIDLILCNPPFHSCNKTQKLYPMLFLEHIFKIFGKNIPLVFIVPSYFIYNSKKRMKILEQYNITHNINLHKTVFNESGVTVECNVLFFNIKQKKSESFYISQQQKKQRTFYTIALNKKQSKFIEDLNINNFNKFIKELIKSKYDDFEI